MPSQAALAYPADSPNSLRFGQGPFHDAPTPAAVRRQLADGVVEIVDTPDGERMQFTVARAPAEFDAIVEIDRGNGRGETLALAALPDNRSRFRSATAPQGPHEFDARLRLRAAGQSEALPFHVSEPVGHHVATSIARNGTEGQQACRYHAVPLDFNAGRPRLDTR